jgi:uncharacterized membrane protein
MTVRPDVLAAILAMAAAAYLCRAGGFYLMRFVALTPRVEATLCAIPVALVASILAVAAVKGGPPEWAGMFAAMLSMVVTRNDFAAMVAGVGVVAVIRSLV